MVTSGGWERTMMVTTMSAFNIGNDYYGESAFIHIENKYFFYIFRIQNPCYKLKWKMEVVEMEWKWLGVVTVTVT